MDTKIIMKKLRQYNSVKLMYKNISEASEIIGKISYIQKSFVDTNISPVSYDTIEKVCDNNEKILNVIENLKDIKKEDYEEVLNDYRIFQKASPIEFLDFIDTQIKLYKNIISESEKSEHCGHNVSNISDNEKNIKSEKDTLKELSEYLIHWVLSEGKEILVVNNPSEHVKLSGKIETPNEIKIFQGKTYISNKYNVEAIVVGLKDRFRVNDIESVNKCLKKLINKEINGILIVPIINKIDRFNIILE